MKNFKKTFCAIAMIAALSGCATNGDYLAYTESQRAIASAKANAEIARYKALSDIAAGGDTAAKVAAVMSIQFNSAGAGTQPAAVSAPRSSGEVALQWASLLLPNVTQLYSISQNSKVALAQSENSTAAAIAQSNNAATVAVSTNSAFVGIASKIQAPAANVTNTTTTSSANTTTTSSANTTTSTTNETNSRNAPVTTTTTDNTHTPTVVVTGTGTTPTTITTSCPSGTFVVGPC